MLKAKQPNSRTIMNFSSIKLSVEIKIHGSYFNFKQMEMKIFKLSLNN